MRVFGLIGYPLGHSFSGKYFANKFSQEKISDCSYNLFPLASITELPALLAATEGLCGLNVTIPYKEQVLPYLDAVDQVVAEIGACNCLRIDDGKITGFNTDVVGFRESLMPQLLPHHDSALVLGTGGAAKAVCYVLKQMHIPYILVSRHGSPAAVSYDSLSASDIAGNKLIINTTPLGTYPDVQSRPAIPYEGITSQHYLFDLVYNPPVTAFLEEGIRRGAVVKNGGDMLALQAEESWRIWNTVSRLG